MHFLFKHGGSSNHQVVVLEYVLFHLSMGVFFRCCRRFLRRGICALRVSIAFWKLGLRITRFLAAIWQGGMR